MDKGQHRAVAAPVVQCAGKPPHRAVCRQGPGIAASWRQHFACGCPRISPVAFLRCDLQHR